VILRLAVLIQYRRVTHTQTHTHRHTMMAITRAGKNCPVRNKTLKKEYNSVFCRYTLSDALALGLSVTNEHPSVAFANVVAFFLSRNRTLWVFEKYVNIIACLGRANTCLLFVHEMHDQSS